MTPADKPQVLGWRCPWSGDDNDPIPRRYWIWYRLYRWANVARHWGGWHQWAAYGMVDHAGDQVYAQRRWHCEWCGANRTWRR
jgi:hypothetical protein